MRLSIDQILATIEVARDAVQLMAGDQVRIYHVYPTPVLPGFTVARLWTGQSIAAMRARLEKWMKSLPSDGIIYAWMVSAYTTGPNLQDRRVDVVVGAHDVYAYRDYDDETLIVCDSRGAVLERGHAKQRCDVMAHILRKWHDTLGRVGGTVGGL